MSMNPINDILSVYVEEVFKPQLGKSSPAPAAAPQKKASTNSVPGDAAVKRIRQAVYDIRYRARREDIPLPQAYSQYMSHTSMNAVEKNSVRDKLGMGPGGGSSVKEEVVQKKYQVRVTPKKGFGNSYVRYATDKKIERLRSNPQISSVEKTKYGTPYEGERKKGEQTSAALQHKPEEKKAKKDYDGDGKLETSKQEWKGSRDNAIKKAMGVSKESVEVPTGDLKSLVKKALKRVDSNVSGFVNGDDSSDKTMGVFIPSPDGKKKVYGTRLKEGFSNWRDDLNEVVDDDILAKSQKEIKEKKVNNKIIINPQLGEEVQLLESVELSEEYVDQIINLASQYFYSEGYDEKDINVIIEGMGYDQFVDFVFDIGNTFFLDEAAYQGELLTSKGKARKNPKTSAAKGASTPVAHTSSSAEKKKPEEKKSSPGQLSIDFNKKPTPPGQQKVKDAVGGAVKKASSPEAKKAVGKAVKGAADTAARAALSAWKGHKAAMQKKKEGGSVAKQVGAGLGAAAGAFFKKGKEHLKNSYQFTDWLDYIISERCDISDWTINDLYEQYKLNEAIYGQSEKLNEKAVSQNQQQLAGMALKYLDGDMPDASDAVKKMAKMGRTELRKFAKTKHKGLPEVKEAIVDQPGSADNQVRDTQDDTVRRQQLKKKEELLRKQQALERQRIMLQKAGRLPVNSGYEPEGDLVKETKKPSALDIVRQQVIAKHGAASIMGTPEQKAAAEKRAKESAKKPQPKPKKRYEDDVYSKDGLGGIRGYRSGD